MPILQDKRDVEWKFMRTELWLSFIEPGCPVAPPFNIIPTPKTIMKFVSCIKNCLCRCGCKSELKRTSMFKKVIYQYMYKFIFMSSTSGLYNASLHKNNHKT